DGIRDRNVTGVQTCALPISRLLDFINDLIGHIRGGTGIVAAATSTFFGSVSGSSQATIAAIGRPMRDRALHYGYKDSHIMGLIKIGRASCRERESNEGEL